MNKVPLAVHPDERCAVGVRGFLPARLRHRLRHPTVETVVPPQVQAEALLRDIDVPSDRRAVIGVLTRYRSLRVVFSEAVRKVRELFDSKPRVRMGDGEQLILLIPVPAAGDPRLSILDEAWWFDNSHRAEGRLIIDVSPP